MNTSLWTSSKKLTFWWWHIEISNYTKKICCLGQGLRQFLILAWDTASIVFLCTLIIHRLWQAWHLHYINNEANHCKHHIIMYIHPKWKFKPCETKTNASEQRVLTSSYSTSAYYWNQRRNPTQLWVLGWVWTVHTFLVAFLSSTLEKWGRHTPK